MHWGKYSIYLFRIIRIFKGVLGDAGKVCLYISVRTRLTPSFIKKIIEKKNNHIKMNIYVFIVLIVPIFGFTITAKVPDHFKKIQGHELQRKKNREISPAQCKTLTKTVKTDLSKSRPVNKLTIKILLKYCMTETRLKLISSLSSKAKRDSLRW